LAVVEADRATKIAVGAEEVRHVQPTGKKNNVPYRYARSNQLD